MALSFEGTWLLFVNKGFGDSWTGSTFSVAFDFSAVLISDACIYANKNSGFLRLLFYVFRNRDICFPS